MKYPEKENFLRVINWDQPSHVCYPAPVQTVSYFGAWPQDVRPDDKPLKWQDIWGVTWEDYEGEEFPKKSGKKFFINWICYGKMVGIYQPRKKTLGCPKPIWRQCKRQLLSGVNIILENRKGNKV